MHCILRKKKLPYEISLQTIFISDRSRSLQLSTVSFATSTMYDEHKRNWNWTSLISLNKTLADKASEKNISIGHADNDNNLFCISYKLPLLLHLQTNSNLIAFTVLPICREILTTTCPFVCP
jgi:hypothetical protein